MADRLALGTVQFGMPYGVANRTGQVEQNEVARILGDARAAGLDTLDTAIGYGDSERRLGEAGVSDWRVVTKLPAIPPDTRDISAWVAESVARSLERLRIDQLHGLLLHRPQDLEGPRGDELYGALVAARDGRMVTKIGVSVYGPEELDAHASRFRFDLVQAPFNVLDRQLATSGWLARLRAAGTEVHTRSAFLQGLLLMDPTERPPRFDAWRGLLGRWDAWRAAAGVSALEACIGFALSHDAIDRVVVGVDSAAHLQEIIRASGTAIAAVPEELESVDLDLISPARWRAE